MPRPLAQRTWALLVLVLLVAATFRLPALDRVPPAINQDEAVHAYDAWCILHTGRDHHGEAWPVFFRAFGDYHPGIIFYLLVPVQAVLGLSTTSTRLPCALAGILAVLLAFLLVRRFRSERTALIAAMILAITPWHVHTSRLAFEAAICPTLILLGLWLGAGFLGVSSGQRQEGGLLVRALACGIVLGVTLWTYHAMRVFVPLLLVAIAAAAFPTLHNRLRNDRVRRLMVVAVAGFFIGLAPFLYTWATAPQKAWARAEAVSVWSRDEPSAAKLAKIARGYFANLSPDFLFISGDPSLVHSVSNHGELYLFTAILIPIGIHSCVRRWRTDAFSRLLLLWLVVGPIPAALASWTGGHCLRSIGGLPALVIVSAIGLETIFDASRRVPRLLPGILGLSILIMAGSAIGYATVFFGTYPTFAAERFQSEWKDVIAAVEAHRQPDDLVVLSIDRTNQLGILYLFWTRMDPRAYLGSPHEFTQGARFERLGRIGHVYFAPSQDLARIVESAKPRGKILIAERADIPLPGRILDRFKYPDGRYAVVLYEMDAMNNR